MMVIGIVGDGFVGGAVRNAFFCEKVIVDPITSDSTFADLAGCDAVFVCVPTPMSEDGRVDSSIVRDVVSEISPEKLIILKSTVVPSDLQEIAEGRRLVYNPEFLTQRNAKEDFLKPDSLIFGGDIQDCQEAHTLYMIYSNVNCKVPYFYTDLALASLVKYTLNCHFAAKVTFFNEIYQLHKAMGRSDWNDFTAILGADKRLGPTHLQVPGPDGEFGFGGACFPKDTAALLHFADSLGVDLTVLRQAVEINEVLRG